MHCDTYYSPEWFDYIFNRLGPSDGRRWGISIRSDGTAEHYVDLWIEDPAEAIIFRLTTGV